ncbi:MAG: hypothetical protein SGILL_008816 [Bacillariaceae sp.]
MEKSIEGLQKQAQRSMRKVKAKVKRMEQGVEDAKRSTSEEYGRFQRTMQFIWFKMSTTCDNFYERVHEGVQCVQETVTSTDDDKEKALKERCVMVNDWNTGVTSKRSMIEVQTRGNPMQTYEPRVPKSSTRYERSLVDQDIYDGNRDRSASHRSILEDEDARDDEYLYGEEEDDDAIEELSDSNYWYTQGMAKKSWPVQVENEVVIRKKGEESRQETLDQIIGVFKRNMIDYNHLTE